MKLLFIIRCVKSNIAGTSSHIFVMVICRGYLPQEFGAVICRGNLPQLFAVRIQRGYLPWVCFVYVSKPFFCESKSFFFVSKSFLFESKPFLICEQNFFISKNFFINAVSFCYCRGSNGPPYTGAFPAFSTRARSSNSKAFIYLKSLKFICEEVNL